MIRSEEQDPATRTALGTFAANWLTIENLSLLAATGLITAGAAGWSARAALVTCGSLILGITLLRLGIGR